MPLVTMRPVTMPLVATPLVTAPLVAMPFVPAPLDTTQTQDVGVQDRAAIWDTVFERKSRSRVWGQRGNDRLGPLQLVSPTAHCTLPNCPNAQLNNMQICFNPAKLDRQAGGVRMDYTSRAARTDEAV